MSNETQPFDQLATVFRDAVVDKVKQSDGYGENSPFNTDDTQEWSEGFINTADCAQIVFRDFLERGIIAARQPAPVVGDVLTMRELQAAWNQGQAEWAAKPPKPASGGNCFPGTSREWAE